MELFVDEKFRRRGTGKALVNEMESVLALQGVFYTQLGCVSTNARARSFYEQIGYRGNHMWYIKKSNRDS